jgi:uncharacterized protein (DUF1778 family)
MSASLATTRFDLKMDASEKDIVSRGAALEREATLRMSAQDFDQFSQAIQGAFKPNKALQGALKVAAKVKRA